MGAGPGPQLLAYDVWWHLKYDTVITSESATPSMIENGLNPEDLLGRKFGHHVNFWSMSERKLTQRVDLGDQHQMVLELRPAHDPSKAWGFVDTVISAEDLSASVWLWHKNGDRWSVDEVITIPAEPADADDLPPLLSPLVRRPRWSPTSICRSTIAGCTYHAGAQENSSSTTSATRPSARDGVGSPRRDRATRADPAAPDLPLAVDRRWWRLAATVGGCTSRTRCTRPGTTRLPRRRRGMDGRLTPTCPPEVLSRVRFFPHDDVFRACGSTRPGSRVATRRATPTATPAERPPAEVGVRGNRCLSCLRCSGRHWSVDVELRYVEGCRMSTRP